MTRVKQSETHFTHHSNIKHLQTTALHIQKMHTQGPIPNAPQGHTWHSLMGLALEEAQKGAQAGEIPVGAVIVSTQGKILAKAHNGPVHLQDPTAHAEILALRAAGKALHNYRLNNCILIVTLEPCLMCAGAMVHSRLSGVVYGAADTKQGAISSCCDGLNYSFLNHTVWHMGGVRSQECAHLLWHFFRTKP